MPNVTFDIEGMRKRMNEYAEECEREERLYRIRKAGERKEGRRCRNGTREYRKNGKGMGVCYTKAEMPKDHDGTSGGDKSSEDDNKPRSDVDKAKAFTGKDEGINYDASKVTEKQKKAVVAYQDYYSKRINTALRDRDSFMRKYRNSPKMIKRIESYIKEIKDAIANTVQKEPTIVFRGTDLDEYVALVGEHPSKEHIGKTYTKKDFTSTSVSNEVSEMFLHKYKEKAVKFVISTPSGKGIAFPVGSVVGEKQFKKPQREILLACETKFEITRIERNDKYLEVHLNVII